MRKMLHSIKQSPDRNTTLKWILKKQVVGAYCTHVAQDIDQ
jgi:hypothetical protein